MVSGAAVVAHKPTFDRLLVQHRGILGLDMEAYAVAAAALGAGKPRPLHLVVKGVCDHADKDKHGDFQQYAASVSTAFAVAAADRILSR
jgi:nucleoside phosphorylase